MSWRKLTESLRGKAARSENHVTHADTRSSPAARHPADQAEQGPVWSRLPQNRHGIFWTARIREVDFKGLSIEPAQRHDRKQPGQGCRTPWLRSPDHRPF